jgi:hypothetical protein
MTTATMKLVTVNVDLTDELLLPMQRLDDGEFIIRQVVELQDLYPRLRGKAKNYLTRIDQ